MIGNVKNKKPDILIIELSAVGDVVHSLPFLEVLRDRFPFAMIDWMKEYDVERFYRDHKLLEIGEGTSEVQRIVISRLIEAV